MFVEIGGWVKAKRERDGVCGALSCSLFLLRVWVQFPSNGIVCCKRSISRKKVSMAAFQFPSNGIVYCKCESNKTENLIISKKFQFPSNGIVCCKECAQCSPRHRSLKVSIPFKRDSVLQGSGKSVFLGGLCEFQFPSNGIVYCKTSTSTTARLLSHGFNSLQTG